MVFVFVVAGITLGKAAQPASAMNPVRTTPDAVVNTVWEDLNYHWDWYMRYYGHSYYRPRLVYYNYSANGYTYDFQTSCGSTAGSHGTMGFYCPTDSSLALDWTDL
jgi:predicted metalloprotease